MRRGWKSSTAAHRWLPSLPQIRARPKPGLDICGNKVIRGLVGNTLRGGESTKWPHLDMMLLWKWLWQSATLNPQLSQSSSDTNTCGMFYLARLHDAMLGIYLGFRCGRGEGSLKLGREHQVGFEGLPRKLDDSIRREWKLELLLLFKSRIEKG